MVTFLVYHYLGPLVLFWSFLKSLGSAGQNFPRQFGQEICVLHTKRKQEKIEVQSKSQLYFRNELLPSSGLVGCVGYC